MFIVLLSRLHQLSLSRHHHVNRLKIPLNQKSSSTYTQTLSVIETRGERLLQVQALQLPHPCFETLEPGPAKGNSPWTMSSYLLRLFYESESFHIFLFSRQVGCEGRYRHVLLGEILLPIRELSGFVSYRNRLLFLTMFLSYQLGKVCISPLK